MFETNIKKGFLKCLYCLNIFEWSLYSDVGDVKCNRGVYRISYGLTYCIDLIDDWISYNFSGVSCWARAAFIYWISIYIDKAIFLLIWYLSKYFIYGTSVFIKLKSEAGTDDTDWCKEKH